MVEERTKRENQRGVSVIDINDLIRKTLSLVDYQCRKQEIEVRINLFDEPLMAEVDAAALKRVLLNLFLGQIQTLEGSRCERYIEVSTAQKGRSAEIHIRDAHSSGMATGEGLQNSGISMILPGTGMKRLAEMVEAIGGTFSYYEQRDGRSFRVVVPLSEEFLAKAKGRYRILVVDDEEVVLDVLKGYIEFMGSEPVVYSSPLKALEELKDLKVDMAVVDLRMPRMGGLEFIRRLEEFLPRDRVVLLTGDILSIEAGLAQRYPEVPVIEKPVNYKKFESIIKVIEGRIK